MSEGFNVTARMETTPPRDPEELRARAADLLRARLAEIWADMRARQSGVTPARSSPSGER